MRSFSRSETWLPRFTPFCMCAKNSLGVGELLARANSAVAKSGSSARALSKCSRESCARRRSERSRPSRYSFRASSDFVVMGILPSEAETDDSPTPLLLQAINDRALRARVTANAKRSILFRRIECLHGVVMFDLTKEYTMNGCGTRNWGRVQLF